MFRIYHLFGIATHGSEAWKLGCDPWWRRRSVSLASLCSSILRLLTLYSHSGSMGVQYAKAMGLRVVVVDHGAEKKKLSLERGAEAFVDFVDSADVAADVKKITGGGAHAVVVVSHSKPR